MELEAAVITTGSRIVIRQFRRSRGLSIVLKNLSGSGAAEVKQAAACRQASRVAVVIVTSSVGLLF